MPPDRPVTVVFFTGEETGGELRAADLACRYGGDEFCLLLPETELDGARVIAERIRAAVQVEKDLARERLLWPVPLGVETGDLRFLDGHALRLAAETPELVEARAHLRHRRLTEVQLLDIAAGQPTNELCAAADAHSAIITAPGTGACL